MKHPKIPILIRIRNFFAKIAREWYVFLVVFTLFFVVITGSVFFNYNVYFDLNNDSISNKRVNTSQAASIIKEQLDDVIGVASTHMHNETFQNIVESGNWKAALDSESHILTEVPYIERANLFSTQGILEASIPYDAKIAGSYGIDISYRSYFQAVSKNWNPYAGEIVTPVVPIDHAIVPVVIPIKTKANQVIAVLIVNLNVDVVRTWIKNVNLGESGLIYVVDNKGRLIYHPNIKLTKELADLSGILAVQKVIKGETGSIIDHNSSNNEEQLSSYSPVLGYGWGVVTTQPTNIAFMIRNNTVNLMLIIELFIVFMLGLGIFLILRDRSKFRDQRDREEILSDNIGDSVIVVDRDWHVTLWSNSSKQITGWLREDVLNKPLFNFIKLIRETDRSDNTQVIKAVMNTGHADNIDYPTILVGKNNKEVVVNIGVAPVLNDDRKVTGVIIVIRDISKKREALMLHSDFAYASHQLRTPITEALWSLEAVLEESDPKEIKKNAKMAHSSLESVKKLSEELVTVSEVDQGEIYLDIAKFKLISLLDEVIEEVGKKAGGRDIEIQIKPSILPSVHITTGRKLLGTILVEILDNAIIYSRDNSKITMSIKNDEKSILFEIKDSGIGIDEEHQPLIFTKFFRGSNFSTSGIAGAGLGLYIARGYVKLLDGKIWFKSEKNKGTTFYVLIPLPIK